MKFIIGLVASGKTTLYRKLNEEKICNAMEIELPNICVGDEKLQKKLFNLYYNNKNIDMIIAHPLFMYKGWYKRLNKNDTIKIINVPTEERIKRIDKRSKEINSKQILFTEGFIDFEEDVLEQLIKNLEYKNIAFEIENINMVSIFR